MAVKGRVAGQQHLQRGGAHHPRLVPTGKGQRQIARAGGKHDPAEPDEPGTLSVGQADNLFRQALHARAVAVNAPGCRPEQKLDACFHCLFKCRHRHKHGFEHPLAVLRCRGHPATKIERHVIAHQRTGNRILVNQKHRSAGLLGIEGSSNTAGTRADYDHVIVHFSRTARAIDRANIGSGEIEFHQAASNACARSAIRSSTCSSPTESRMVPSVMPPSRRCSGVSA